MIIEVESVERMIEKTGANHFIFNGKCHKCRTDIEIEITKTASGYGLQNGIMYEPRPHHFLVVCDHCYRHFGHLSIAEVDSGS